LTNLTDKSIIWPQLPIFCFRAVFRFPKLSDCGLELVVAYQRSRFPV